jgi:competence protein ComGC
MIKNKKSFVLISMLVIVLDCIIDILLLRLFWKNLTE